MLLNRPSSQALPPPSHLRDAVNQLALQERWRELIQLIQAWEAQGDITDHARLRQAQAFLALRQMERAWTRLRPLLDQEHPDRETFETAAQYFITRGWTEKARDLLKKALDLHPDVDRLQQLWDQAAAPAASPPDLPPSTASLSLKEHLPVAEDYLASGQVLSARSLLERLGRQFPGHSRVTDLLWGLAGDYSPPESSLAKLVEAAAPREIGTGDFGEDEHTESMRNTAEVTLEEPRPSSDDPTTRGFPNLFRGQDPAQEQTDEVTDEVTAARRLNLIDGPDPFAEDSPTEIDTGGDTRVLKVIDLAGPGGPGSEPATDEGPARLDRDLLPSYATDLEDEDDDLVVLTNRRPKGPLSPPPIDDDPTLSQVGREVAHLLGPPKKKRKKAAAPPPAPTSEEPAKEPPLLEPDPPTDPQVEPRGAAPALWVWLIVLALVLMLGLVFATSLLVLIFWL